jgi:hypothetical protein
MSPNAQLSKVYMLIMRNMGTMDRKRILVDKQGEADL